LKAIQNGDSSRADELLPLVYEELRRIAISKLRNEPAGHTLQPTALVHEVWLKISASDRQVWRGRSHFLGAAAEAMRRILVDRARRKASGKGGANAPIEELVESRIELLAPSDEILAVHEALDALAIEDPQAAEIVKLRYFVGLSLPEISEALETSPRSVDRQWAFARAWLMRRIRNELKS
jgi:RNA polymerase sigma factor (TIGR02999 family)